MKTAKDVLIYENNEPLNTAEPWVGYNSVMSAIQQFAQQQACAFARYTDESNFTFIEESGNWVNINTDEELTPEQLYQQFKDETNG